MTEQEEQALEKILNDIAHLIGVSRGIRKQSEYNRSLLRLVTKNSINIFKEEDEMLSYKGINIKRRADGRYVARFSYLGERRDIYGKTQKECYEKLKKNYTKIKKEIEEESNLSSSLHVWLDKWYQTYKTDLKSKEYEIAIRLHIKPNIKNIPLQKITALMLQELLNKIDKSRTKITVFNILNECLRSAVQNNLIKSNPMEKLKKPKHEKTIGTALTVAEEQKLLSDYKNTNQYYLIRFYLYSGVRRAEALNLKWEDIDEEKGYIHIRGTKTEKSDRYIPIFPELKKIIEELPRDKELLFDFKQNTVTQKFKRTMPNHKLHDLRHTFATRCIEKGIPMKYLQKWMGHSSYHTTANIYSHATNEKYEKELINLLDFNK